MNIFDIFLIISKIPIIIGILVLFYLVFKIVKALYEEIVYTEGSFFSKIINFFDPYRQSFFSFKYSLINVVI
jgi:hypothetical protein